MQGLTLWAGPAHGRVKPARMAEPSANVTNSSFQANSLYVSSGISGSLIQLTQVIVLVLYSSSDFVFRGINTDNSQYVLKIFLPCTASQNWIFKIPAINWYQLCLQPWLAGRDLSVSSLLEERAGPSARASGCLWKLGWELWGVCVNTELFLGYYFFPLSPLEGDK